MSSTDTSGVQLIRVSEVGVTGRVQEDPKIASLVDWTDSGTYNGKEYRGGRGWEWWGPIVVAVTKFKS